MGDQKLIYTRNDFTARESSGFDRFKNGFTYEEWSAPRLKSLDEIRSRLESFGLCGRRIKRMKFIGCMWDLSRDGIENIIENRVDVIKDLTGVDETDFDRLSLDLPFHRYIPNADYPILIEFEDEDVLAIDASSFRMGMNQISWWDEADERPNVNASEFFAPCIGKTLASTIVNESSGYDVFKSIEFRFDDGSSFAIGHDDFGEVNECSYRGERENLTIGELKAMLMNWEDLHWDEVTGFRAKSDLIFFGEKGEKSVGSTRIDLFATNEDDPSTYVGEDWDWPDRPDGVSHAHIEGDYPQNFLLLDWSIYHLFGYFSVYDVCKFTSEDWNRVLDEAARILMFESFDDLFDDLVSWRKDAGGTPSMRWALNYHGEEFWRRRKEFAVLLDDLRGWSKLVLENNNTMHVCGF